MTTMMMMIMAMAMMVTIHGAQDHTVQPWHWLQAGGVWAGRHHQPSYFRLWAMNPMYCLTACLVRMGIGIYIDLLNKPRLAAPSHRL